MPTRRKAFNPVAGSRPAYGNPAAFENSTDVGRVPTRRKSSRRYPSLVRAIRPLSVILNVAGFVLTSMSPAAMSLSAISGGTCAAPALVAARRNHNMSSYTS